jgi:NitT/TauT family transport system permease protein
VALGMSWKSGIAAEVIGVPLHSIGEKLYLSKIYLSTADLFAWTLVIILLSALFEFFFLWLLSLASPGIRQKKKEVG